MCKQNICQKDNIHNECTPTNKGKEITHNEIQDGK